MKFSSYEPLEMRGTFLKMAFFKMAASAIIKYKKNIISLAPDKIE